MSGRKRRAWERGPIAWMVDNRVTSNLLMLALLLGGLFMSSRIKQEVFPEFELDMVRVSVVYPGAGPEEVEQGIVLSVEQAISGLEGVEEITAAASEGGGTVTAELLAGADVQKVLQDIKQEVDRITTFPEDAEEPVVNLATRRRQVLTMQLHGEVSERVLRELAEQTRDRLLQHSGITQVDVVGGREFEVLVEVPQEALRAFGLSLQDVSRAIAGASVELPGGKLETGAGEILLRVKDRRDWASQFARIPLLTTAEGTVLYLEDLARVSEDFEDTNRTARYDGRRSIGLSVFRVGDQTPIGVSDATRSMMEEIGQDLPPGVDWAINSDRSDIYRQRLELLLKNAALGLVLVLGVLGLFLEFKLAFWVTMGIPTSFLGGLLFLPGMGVSINMISMFAFIIALGIVVDDAIIAGENIYEYRRQGMDFRRAAILGARDVATPIAFSILTNIVAFMPLYFVPGLMGKIWQVIPLVVCTVFLISWVESLVILPSHLAHTGSRPASRLTASLHRRQQAFSAAFSRMVRNYYGPFLALCLRFRGISVALGTAFLILVGGYVASGRIGMVLMPRVESDRAVVTASLPVGSPFEAVAAVEKKLVEAAQEVAQRHGGEDLVLGVFSLTEENRIEVSAYLSPPDVRPMSTREMTRLWKEQAGNIGGLQSLRFESDRGGPGGGAALTVELSHRSVEVLDRASVALGERLAEFPNVTEIDDGYTPGKMQFDFRLTERGQSLGLTGAEVARQVRNAYQGAIALRQQRGNNEVTVRVRLPKGERISEYDLENLLVRTPAGIFVPLAEIAEVQKGRAYTGIARRDGRRVVTVTADVEPVDQTSLVLQALNETTLPRLAADFPGLTYGYEGRQADMKESMSSLGRNFLLALLVIYFLLAIPFRSYFQPLIVMVAIPFGIVGAVLGHFIMGYSLSVVSMMGIVALSGVVVNDSLVLIDYANKLRGQGESRWDAIQLSAIRRFRPVLLTTLTTFGGLAPMIFETSRQARFLIPMALSLGFGILFATVITLLLVPCLYLLIEDMLALRKPGAATEPVEG